LKTSKTYYLKAKKKNSNFFRRAWKTLQNRHYLFTLAHRRKKKKRNKTIKWHEKIAYNPTFHDLESTRVCSHVIRPSSCHFTFRSKHKFSKAISVTNIKHQVKQNLIDKNLVQKSWFFAESGCSDIFNCFLHYGTPTLDPDAYVQAMLAQAGNLIDQIYRLGARRIALFSLGRPVGCNPARALLPGAPVDKCSGKMNLMVII